MLSRDQLQRAAADAGYPVESYEKVYTLVQVLDGLRAHPFLGSRLALKGGTALNLFVLDLPRLSVDIDLNYIGSPDRTTAVAERPRVEQALEQVFGRAGLSVKRAPTGHAGGKWRLSYTTALGRPGSIDGASQIGPWISRLPPRVLAAHSGRSARLAGRMPR